MKEVKQQSMEKKIAKMTGIQAKPVEIFDEAKAQKTWLYERFGMDERK